MQTLAEVQVNKMLKQCLLHSVQESFCGFDFLCKKSNHINLCLDAI